jgi:hypothetical protein
VSVTASGVGLPVIVSVTASAIGLPVAVSLTASAIGYRPPPPRRRSPPLKVDEADAADRRWSASGAGVI